MEEKKRASQSAAISDFYSEGTDTGTFSAETFRSQIRQELSRDRDRRLRTPDLKADPKAAAPSAPARKKSSYYPLIVSVILAAVALIISRHSFSLDTEKLASMPSELYSTENLLIETLKKRSDIDISQRDRLIADYEKRERLRESYAKQLSGLEVALSTPVSAQTDPSSAADKAGSPVQSSAASTAPGLITPQSAEAENRASSVPLSKIEPARVLAGSDTVLQALADARKEKTDMVNRLIALEDENRQLKSSLLDAQNELGNKTLAAPVQTVPASAAEPAAAGPAAALSAAPAARPSSTAAAQQTGSTATAVSAALIAERQTAAHDGSLPSADGTLPLPDEQLPGQSSAAAQSPAPVQEPPLITGAFIGTLSIVSGRTLLMDLSISAALKPGETVLICRAGGSGQKHLVAKAIVRSLSASSASLELAADTLLPGDTPLVFDTVYLAPKKQK